MRRFFVFTILLSLIGLFFVFESSVAESFQTFGEPYHFVRLQAYRLVIGLVALFITWFLVPLKLLQKLSWPIFFASLALLLAVLTPLGIEIQGARRWLGLGPILFQPIELVKFTSIVFFASWLTKHQRLLPFLFFTGILAMLLLFQPDLGSLLIVLSIAFGLFFVAGGKLQQIIPVSLLALALLVVAVFSSPYRLRRLRTFLNPSSDPLGASFHIHQITLALGNGGWFGQGIAKSKQKYSYIPEASSDSIFAIVAEELGFLGSLVILTIFFLYFRSGIQIVASKKKNHFLFLLGAGCLIWLMSQTLLNLAAVVALVPLTGLPLPFFSYGGTSLIMTLFVSGVILNIAKTKS